MLSESELTSIREGLKGAERSVKLILHAAEQDSALGTELAELVAGLAAAAGDALTVEPEAGDEPLARPALTIARGEQKNVRYLAMPSGHQAGPFVETLVRLGQNEGLPAEPWAERLTDLQQPAELLIFVAPTCPHCPHVVRAATQLATSCPPISATIVDVQRFPELSQRYSVRAVPLTVLDGGMSWTGAVTAQQLAEQIVARHTERYRAQAFASMVDTGRVSDAAREMLAGRGVSHFLAAWRSSATSSRMGLLLAAEEALEQGAGCLDRIVPALVELLAADDAALQGDTADLLGKIGHPDAIEALEGLLDHPNPDVADIATEAIDEIKSVGRG